MLVLIAGITRRLGTLLATAALQHGEHMKELVRSEGDSKVATVIGSAYVHGSMLEGEAFNSLDRGPERTSVLI